MPRLLPSFLLEVTLALPAVKRGFPGNGHNPEIGNPQETGCKRQKAETRDGAGPGRAPGRDPVSANQSSGPQEPSGQQRGKPGCVCVCVCVGVGGRSRPHYPLTSGRGSWRGRPGRPPARRVRDQSGREGAGGEVAGARRCERASQGAWQERGSAECRKATETRRDDERSASDRGAREPSGAGGRGS